MPSIQSAGSILELLDVYPNPSSGLFKISYVSATQDKKEIRIVNQLGQLVKTIHLEQSNIGLNTIDMDVKGLIEGMYHVQLISGDEVKSRKIIIK